MKGKTRMTPQVRAFNNKGEIDKVQLQVDEVLKRKLNKITLIYNHTKELSQLSEYEGNLRKQLVELLEKEEKQNEK